MPRTPYLIRKFNECGSCPSMLSIFVTGMRSQLRFTVLDLLKVGQSGSARYADPYGSVQSGERREGFVSWRGQYEYRF